MTHNELATRLAVSPNHSLVVDRRLADESPGYVRSVEVLEDLQVVVSFEPWGFDDAGVYFRGQYDTLESVVAHLEHFLGTPLASWRDCDLENVYPPRPAVASGGAFQRLTRDAAAGSIALPGGASYFCQGA